MIRQDFNFPGLELLFTRRPLNLRAKTQGEKVVHEMDQALKFLSLKPRQIYSCNQIHSNIVYKATDLDHGQDFHYGRIFRDGDGIVTNLSQVALVSKVADCVPLLLYDPKKQVQANLHSGWKGTLAQIGLKALDIMTQDYGCHLEDIHAFIGPAIGKEDFEVKEDVSSKWYQSFSFADLVVRKKDSDHQLIDLKETNRLMLIESGIKEGQIVLAKESTFQDQNLHSYRRDKPNYGINGLISMLVP